MAQQIEAAAAVHRALGRLQLADLSLHRPGAPGQRQRRTHRRQIALEARGEAGQGGLVGGRKPTPSKASPCLPRTRARNSRATVMVRVSLGAPAIRAATKARSVALISSSSATTSHAARRREGVRHGATPSDGAAGVACRRGRAQSRTTLRCPAKPRARISRHSRATLWQPSTQGRDRWSVNGSSTLPFAG